MNDSLHRVPCEFHLYEEGDLQVLDLRQLGNYLTEKAHIPCRLHGNIFQGVSFDKEEVIARGFVRAKVKGPGKEFIPGEPLQAEYDYEKRRMGNPKWGVSGILYNGILYQRVIADLINREKIDFRHCTILFTNQLFGTWDLGDLRYHARVSLYGFPSMISTTGLVEAPAKPKEYYLKRQMGVPVELLEEEYEGRFLDHGDARTTEVMKGYAMQALFFHLTGYPFCEDKDCRLFNSHWQEEVLHSQLDGQYEFCPRHEAILRQLRNR